MYVHSDDVKTWLTKLERIAKLANLDKTVVFNNLGHVLSIEMLADIYQELDGSKAIGIDGVTKVKYGESLNENLSALLQRIRRGTYKPQASRLVEIPKEDGSTRPLAISCFEDKLVQSAVNKIICAIFEPIFLPCSYGFRPARDCHAALRALQQHAYQNQDGAVVEIDIRKYFNSIPHNGMMECLRKRISDTRLLRLIVVLMQTPTMVDGAAVINKLGCPQGSIISPILSNVYLHYAIDAWFADISRTHMQGRAAEVRYADDMVFVFQSKNDASRFFKVLPKRLNKFGLELHLDKSQLIESGCKAAVRANKNGTHVGIYKFLGFTCYWGKAKKGFWRLKYASRGDRFRATLKRIRQFLWKHLNTNNADDLLSRVKRMMQGWINCHGISDNGGCVWTFIHRCKGM